MAHVEKFTKGSVNGLSIHIERKTTNHSNPDIDSERTYLNYDLCDKEGDMNQRLKNRLTKWIQQLTTWLKQLITREKQIEQQRSKGISR
ncbi:plasmid recombination protein [Brochothrix thermosphacta]|uniref:plasmid recombination protein n=1 Tax=Brochothrix thermosphacta TaxID=2756 RepID=UPI001C4F998F|nr:plasmid recombination protein [Brochothrix thermosphacta]